MLETETAAETNDEENGIYGQITSSLPPCDTVR